MCQEHLANKKSAADRYHQLRIKRSKLYTSRTVKNGLTVTFLNTHIFLMLKIGDGGSVLIPFRNFDAQIVVV